MDFTIVTASYNYGHYIGECLESVANQKDVTFEHLVMDACSKDDTAEVVARYPHASFFSEPDKGMTDGINKGFRKAKGEWVMWLNADDRLKPGALKAVKEHVQRSQADVVYGAWDFIDAQGAHLRRMRLFPFRRFMLVHYGCYIGSTACFYRNATTISEGHLLDDRFGFCMDGEYYARLASLGKRFEYLPVVLADFRLHDASISQQSLGKKDPANMLRFQRQSAEPRTVRRLHGLRLSGDEHVNCAVDAVLFHGLRLCKPLLKLAARKPVLPGE